MQDVRHQLPEDLRSVFTLSSVEHDVADPETQAHLTRDPERAMTMVNKGKSARPRRKRLELDEALIALFIGAMDANHHVAREELARAHHLIWSTNRFRRKSGETVGRLIDRMKRLLEEQERSAVMEAAARAIPAKLRPSAFAIVADLLLADGRIDRRERKFLERLAASFNIRARAANELIDAMLVKNHL
jgi:tellurite resistance protein